MNTRPSSSNLRWPPSRTTNPASSPTTSDGQIILTSQNGIPPVEYSINGGATFTTSPFFPNLAPGDYPVLVKDKGNCLVDTTVTVTFINATQDQSAGRPALRMSPNPAQQVVLIQIEDLEGVSVLPIQILDATGKIVRHDRLVAYDGVLVNYLEVGALPSGVYFIRAVHDQYTWVERLVKE